MAITIVNAQATSATAAASTGITVTKPTSLANGDVLYAFISKTEFANTTNYTCSGWTGLTPGTAGSTTQNDRHTTILRKVISNAGGEPANYTFVATGNATSVQQVGIIIALRGVDNSTPEDITVPAYGVISNNSTPVTLNATSATANALAIAHLQISLATAATKTPGAPSTYTLVTGGNASETAGGALDNQCMTATKTLGAAGSTTGTNAWTNGTNDAASESLTAVVLVRAAVTTVQATASAAFGGLGATATATSTRPSIYFPFTQANGAPVGWISLGAIDWGVISGRGTTNNNAGLHGMGYQNHGVDTSGDWEIIVDANASLTIGNGSVNVGLVDAAGIGYSIAIANETHIQVRTSGYVNGGNISGANRTTRDTLVRWTYTASGNWFRLYHDDELVEEIQNTTNTAMMGGAINLVVYLQETTSPTNECSLDNLFLASSIGNQYPPGSATVQATASAAFGALGATATADVTTPSAGTEAAAVGPSGGATFVQPNWRISVRTWGAIDARRRRNMGLLYEAKPVPVDGKAQSSSSSKATLKVTIPVTGKAGSSESAKATLKVTIPVTAKAQSSGSAKADLKIVTAITGKAGSSSEAKATPLVARRIDGKAQNSGSAKADTVRLAIPFTAKGQNSGSAKTTVPTPLVTRRIDGKAQSASSAKATLTVSQSLGTSKAQASSSAKVSQLLAVRGISGKAGSAESAKVSALLAKWNTTGKAPNAESAKANARVAWRLNGKAQSSGSAKADLTVSLGVPLTGKAAASSSAKTATVRLAIPFTGKAQNANTVKDIALRLVKPVTGKSENVGSAKATVMRAIPTALTGRAGSSATAKGELFISGQVDLAGKAPNSASAKATTRVAWRLDGKAQSSGSAKADPRVLRGLTAKAPNAESAKVSQLLAKWNTTGKGANANSAKVSALLAKWAATGKAGSAESAKATLKVTIPVTGKAASANSAKATLDVFAGVTVTGKAGSSGSAKATTVRVAVALTGRAEVAVHTKADVLRVARRIDGKAASSASAKTDTAQLFRRVTGKGQNASSAKADLAVSLGVPLTGKAANAGWAKAAQLVTIFPLPAARAGASSSSKATLRVTRGLDGKAQVSGSAKATPRVLWRLDGKAPTGANAKATVLRVGILVNARAPSTVSAKATLIVVTAATHPITMGIQETGHTAVIYERSRHSIREFSHAGIWETRQ